MAAILFSYLEQENGKMVSVPSDVSVQGKCPRRKCRAVRQKGSISVNDSAEIYIEEGS